MWRAPFQSVWQPVWQDLWRSGGDRFGRQFLLDAATGLVLPGFTYSRSGPALWLPQQDGSLASFAADVLPRSWGVGGWGWEFHPGWTQQLLWTHDTSNSVWTKVLVSEAAGKIVPSTTSGDHFINNNAVATVLAGDTVTITAQLKPDGYTWARLSAGNAAGGVNYTFFDLVNGVVGANSGNTARITKLADGSCLCSVTRVASASGVIGATVYVVPADGTFSWAGDGVRGIQVLSVNLTNTAYPVPLTVATSATGTIGNHSMTGSLSALGVTLGSQYAIGCEWSFSTLQQASSHVARLADVGDSNRALIYRPSNTSQAGSIVISETMATYTVVAAATVGAINKQVIRVKANDTRSALQGVLMAPSGAAVMPVGVDRVVIGHGLTPGANTLAGRITRAYVIPSRAPSDADLAAMTA